MRRVAAHLGVAGAGAAPPNVKVDVVGLLLRLNVKDDLGISPDMVASKKSGTLCDEAFGRERADADSSARPLVASLLQAFGTTAAAHCYEIALRDALA